MTKFPIPDHVLKPGSTAQFVKVADHKPTNMAGLGYSILRALGAHERLPPGALETIKAWSADYGAAHGGITPDTMNLKGQDFDERIGRRWSAHKAAPNASRYPGGRSARPTYAEVYKAVWIEQRWPELCRALAGMGAEEEE